MSCQCTKSTRWSIINQTSNCIFSAVFKCVVLCAGGYKPHRIIMYRDGVSEGQFSHVLQVTWRGNASGAHLSTCFCKSSPYSHTLIKKIIFPNFYKEIQKDRLLSHIWLTTSSDMVKYLRTYSYIRNPFLKYDDHFWISLFLKKFFFLSVHKAPENGTGNYHCTD